MFVVSKQRKDKFLQSDEMNLDDISHEDDGQGYPITIGNATFSWTKDKSDIYLKDLNVKIKEGELVAIVGQVGSGKTALLSALLGDMEKVSGDVNIAGTVGYVPQQAWIQNSTLKQNITFTNAYNEVKYNDIIEKCALADD